MDKKNVLLSLDISSRCTGFAVLRNGRWNKSSASFGMIKITSKLSVPQRLVVFRNEMLALIKKVKPTDIIIEDVFRGRNVATMKLLARFNGVAIELARRVLKKDPQIALAATVRASLGCGKSKEEAFDYICSRYNLEWSFKKMNDVADALALALHGYKILKEV